MSDHEALIAELREESCRSLAYNALISGLLNDAANALMQTEHELSEVHKKLVTAKAVAASAEEMTRDYRTQLAEIKQHCASLGQDAECAEQERR